VMMGGLRSRAVPSAVATEVRAPQLPTVTSVPATLAAGGPTLSPIPAATAVAPASNLEVQIIAVSPRQPRVGEVVNVQVRVRNVSGKAIPNAFWVDLYVSPSRMPTPLVAWSEIATYGATWRVAGLSPGESRDLYSLDADPTRSNLLRLDASETYHLYVVADTLNELPADLNSGQARPTYLGGPAEVVVGNASTKP
jgi:hypothetical protein